ncbi:hypothetical protein C8J57DRAFT_1549495 [Mycena rebaudengoi]|nr:hypothetical protein C8J57DRAFT_1549495 [Mycena rebaudengoi]
MPSGRVSALAAEQLDWLESIFGDFCEKQARNTLGLFWPKMERDWFKQWPVEAELGFPVPEVSADGDAEAEVEVALASDEVKVAIGSATAERKKKLRSWFNSKSQKMKKGDTVKSGQLGTVATVLFKSGPVKTKRTRAKQPIELFQKQYPDLIEAEMQKAGIDDTETLLALAPDLAGMPDPDDVDEDAAEQKIQERLKSARLKMRRDVTKTLFDQLSDEERLELKGLSQAMREDGRRKIEEGPDEEELAARTPEEYQAEIDALPGVLREVHATIERLTGWTGATILGGPTPRQGGKIMSKTYCFGVSPAGNTLVQAIPEWETIISEKMGHWLSRCNPREVRKLRAMATPGATESSPTQALASQAVPGNTAVNDKAIVPPPKKVRKRKVAKKSQTVKTPSITISATTTETAGEVVLPMRHGRMEGIEAGGVDGVGSEGGSLGQDYDLGQGFDGMDLGGTPNEMDLIDPVLLGMSTERLLRTMQNVEPPTISDAAVRPMPRAPCKGAAAPVTQTSPLVEAFGELRPQSVDEVPSNPTVAPFVFPSFVFIQPTPTSTTPGPPPIATGTPVAVRAPPAAASSPEDVAMSPSSPGTATSLPSTTPVRSSATTPSTPTSGASTIAASETSPPVPRSSATGTLSSPSTNPPSATSPPYPSSTTGPSTPTPSPSALLPTLHSSATDTPSRAPATSPHTPSARTLVATPGGAAGRSSAASTPSRTPAVPSPLARSAVIAGQGLPPLPLPSAAPAGPIPTSSPAVNAAPPPPLSPRALTAETPAVPNTGGGRLSRDNFPQSRPLANAPTVPVEPKRGKPTTKGRGGKGKGKENPSASSSSTVPRNRKAAEAWLQTYDDDGNVIPLDPGTATGAVSQKRRRELLAIGQRLDKEREAAEALKDKTRRMLANPDGNHPAAIWVPPPPPPEGQPLKRSRKAALDRDGQPIVAWDVKRKRGELQHGAPLPPTK